MAEISSIWIAATVATIAFMVLFPPLVAWVVNRRIHGGWRAWGFGALIFVVFQVLTRVPATTAIQVALTPQFDTSPALLWGWLVVLSLTAGLFEEVGRYVGYRWLLRRPGERSWATGVLYGLGHGGIESMLLIAGLAILTLVQVLALNNGGLASLPEPTRGIAAQQLAALASQPGWLPLLGGVERAATLAIHVGLSILVLQVFQRGSLWWLVLAIGAHTLVDLASVSLQRLVGSSPGASVLLEVVVACFGLAGLWLTLYFRPRRMKTERVATQ